MSFTLKLYFLFIVALTNLQLVFSQQAPVDRNLFFSDDDVINVQFTTDLRKLRTEKKNPKWQPVHIVMQFADSSALEENIRVQPRGIYRKANCDIAALMVDFKTKNSPLLSNLKKLKFVGGCHNNVLSEEWLIKEYVVYKIYNMLTPMSFRVRLMRITYNDEQQKVKSYTQYAFLIEDMKDLAERNNCKEVKDRKFATEATNRQQMSFVSIFQYMIGNTDWAVPNSHNIKLMVPVTDTFARPYTIPYDFDFCGLVDASYAVPSEGLAITNVRERYYLGYERSLEELKPIVSVFKEKQDSIMQYVNNCELLKPNVRKTMFNYLDAFYNVLKSESSVKTEFIYKALRR